jgi:hypothetical protein
MVPLKGAGQALEIEAHRAGDVVQEAVDDGGLAKAAGVQASAADPTCWLNVEGDRVHKSTLVRHVFGCKGTSNDPPCHVQSMYGTSSHCQATAQAGGVDVHCTGDTGGSSWWALGSSD